MKKITVLFVSALALGMVFTSCNKDDDSGSSTSLEGKWNYSKEGQVIEGQEILMDFEGNEDGCSKDYVMINADGTMSDVDYDSFDAPCEVFTSSMTWSRSGNIVTVIDGEESFDSEILTLTSTELKVKDEDGYITLFTRG